MGMVTKDGKFKVFISGSLFNEAEIAQRKKEEELLNVHFPNKLEIFNPITQPFNDKSYSVPTPVEIFNGDTNALIDSDIVVADLTNNDPGVMMELGIAYSEKKTVIGVLSDIRLNGSGNYEIPTFGFNHYVLGGLQKCGVVVKSFADAIVEVEKIIKAKSA